LLNHEMSYFEEVYWSAAGAATGALEALTGATLIDTSLWESGDMSQEDMLILQGRAIAKPASQVAVVAYAATNIAAAKPTSVAASTPSTS
jgi:hypothetical protein